MKSRDRIVGAVFVLAALAAQVHWMGPAIAVLGVGLLIAYVLWVAARWKNDPAAVLPMYLVAIAVQCLHFAEEYVTGFQRQFPKLIGYQWSDARFVTFNTICLAIFVLAGLGVLPARAGCLPRCFFPCSRRRYSQWCRPSALERCPG